jgi:FkbM family methyltransferase
MFNYHHLARRLANSVGFEFRRMPRALLSNKQHKLEVNLDLICTHLYAMTDRPIFFVQIGANDGVQKDPFLAVAQRLGWRGLLVEPQPDVFDRLKQNLQNMPSFTCLNAAVDRQDGSRTPYRVAPDAPFGDAASELGSFDRQHLIKHDSQFPGIAKHIEEIDVPCMTFDTMLSEVGEADFDVLQIDTEGFDAEVVDMACLSRHQTSVVNFEHKHLSRADWDRSVMQLIEAGFDVTRTWQDTIGYKMPVNQ